MKKTLLPAVLGVLLSAATWAQSPATGSDRTPARPPGVVHDDAVALATLSAINKHEIAAAQIALAKAVDADTKRYATMMQQEHGDNQARTEQLAASTAISPNSNEAVRKLEQESEAKRDALEPMSGAEFRKAYLGAMVADHTQALGKLDRELIPGARNADVAAHLKLTREHVARHLEEAKRLAGDAQAAHDHEH